MCVCIVSDNEISLLNEFLLKAAFVIVKLFVHEGCSQSQKAQCKFVTRIEAVERLRANFWGIWLMQNRGLPFSLLCFARRNRGQRGGESS